MNAWVRLIYNLLLPVLCLLAAPAWVIRMARRGGLDWRLLQRIGIYRGCSDEEARETIYVHAVSVGEVRMALRLITQWQQCDSLRQFVIAATTSTGFQVADKEAPEGVRVIYSPLDFTPVLRSVFHRFNPILIVLIDSEIWPNLLHVSGQSRIPVALANARLSERSARRYQRVKWIAAPMLNQIRTVCVQAEEHAESWIRIGICPERLVITGSLKFDLDGVQAPMERIEFRDMLESFGSERAIVLAASTHHGEERLIAEAIREVPGALAVLLPRHVERRQVVLSDLENAGFEVVLRSRFKSPEKPEAAVFLVDSTGELGDWTALADIVVIGKSFLGRGGQNPVEAILVDAPVVCGPDMSNFEPLVSELRAASAIECVSQGEIAETLRAILASDQRRQSLTDNARATIDKHRGATDRIIMQLRALIEDCGEQDPD